MTGQGTVSAHFIFEIEGDADKENQHNFLEYKASKNNLGSSSDEFLVSTDLNSCASNL
jgi:hypothetical protein